MMDRFKEVPCVLEFIVGANEQRWAALSMLLQARYHHWKKGVLGLPANQVDLAYGSGFATTHQSDLGSAENVGRCADFAALARFSV